jgi:DNA-binding NarL/FixJ family response regulator
MFKKVLIAEDHEVRNLGVVNALTELQIPHFDFVNYCDDALQKIKAAATADSYDLLITDLSFDEDHIEQKVNSGQQLIEEVRKIQPNLKVIAFSIEKKPKIIDDLFKIHNINGFVSKEEMTEKISEAPLKKFFPEKPLFRRRF